MNILIPMAGKGTRFQVAGYTGPKPLIDVLGKPMIQRVVENIGIDGVYIFVVRRQHLKEYPKLEGFLKSLARYVEVIEDTHEFQGQAAACLSAREFINNSEPLLVANSDQLMEWDPEHFLDYTAYRGGDGAILTFNSQDEKNSYVRLNESGFVVQTAEKKVISKLACCGIFYWARGRDFITAVEDMVLKDIKTNGEFYVAPAYNENIAAGLKITTYPIKKHFPIGTPEDLEKWISIVSTRKLTAGS